MTIKQSGLFDENWYRTQYPDVADAGIDPVEHYLWIGAHLGRNPSPTFDTGAYRERHVGSLAENENPLLHHVRTGAPIPISAAGTSGPVGAATASLPLTDPAGIAFSVIMPTRDRAHCIVAAIDSLMAQSHRNFELVIVDDGSTDGTEQLVARKYADALAAGQIVYIRNETGSGVCMARNIGLSKASRKWITYLDSDNTIRPEFLDTFAQAIVRNPQTQTIYANFKVNGSDRIGGRAFDLKDLASRNFIDIGVFCHSRMCYKMLGGFDSELKRLVDWELILRYAKVFPPVHLPVVLMDYCDRDSDERITRNQSYPQARMQVHRKHDFRPTVTIAVLSYNQEEYILQALESAICQKGWFTFEILIADDGSTDRTPEIIAEFAKKHPHVVRNISSPFNMGISENFRRCFREAAGEYIAILEGDDYWEADDNIARKVRFLRESPECSMVFSKIKMVREKNGSQEVRYLERQIKLKTDKLTGSDFIADPNMNLIVNFSACVFVTDLMRRLPYHAYTYRLSEITVAFFLEKHGPIGYINDAMTAYRHHSGGTWSGLTTPGKIRNAMEIREIVRDVADPKYRPAIQVVIDEYVEKLEKLESQSRAAA
ncbi:glycosyltransferase family 2 protein [Croceicoccus marinus]|nr:glycosyltransferase [Croceicoccus marinus]